ncbi:alpha/beta hydrolase [Iodidimonas muriae]|uniref:Alpha/beta hydrolase n=1 Tax=Iodidimonas muriae TaxID=261467 RepID=A0ABQ2LFF4_9PROT|nr:alpha/beta hydrolase [Iodidimonas muriae]GER08511.1 alpha/beta hydrolase [Kordiimonadales bacterium JCM 17843]GGO15282.1 alpha/beta hydrolase [Iodidimonas muriae]
MTDYLSRTVISADGLRLHYRDYPNAETTALPVLCLHGLTRNSADFHDLALHLAPHFRVLAMDVRGRGLSEHDPNPENYHPGTYVADVLALLAQENISKLVVIGTSMGGLIGMALAAQNPDLLSGLVLNDIGPEIDPAGLTRIKGYVGAVEPAKDWDDAIAHMKAINGQALPGLSQAQWERFTRGLYHENADGRPVLAYDPAISMAVKAGEVAPPSMWALYEALSVTPVLVLRGTQSDILSTKTVQDMVQKHPDCTACSVHNRGHAPLLDEPESLAAIDAFLNRTAQ